MNTNQNIQYQSLLNRNVGTNMECDEMLVDDITCINLTSSGTITGNIINATTVTISGKLTATNDVDSIVSNSNTIAVYGISSGNYIIPLVSDTGGSGFRSLYNDISLMYNATNDTITCGKATFTLGLWSTDTPTLVLGDFGTNQGIIQLCGDATKSIFLECSSTGNLEIYQKVGGTLTLLFQITPSIVNVYNDMTITGTLTATASATSTVSQANTINNTNVSSGLYYVSLIPSVGSGYKSLYNNVGISYNITTTTLTVPIIVNSGRSEFLNGNNVQGTNYSAYFGTGNSKSGQLVIWDGLGYNQYTQLACRSNVFIVQGNITSISLQKNTFVIGTLDATTGVNISTGQTYKINSVDQTFLNNLTTTATSSITHTFVSPNLQSNVNALSITNAMLAGSIVNAKLTNSSITIGSTSVSLGATITALTGMSSWTGTGNISTSAGYLQSLIGVSNIVTPSSSTGSLLVGLGSINDGVIKISSASGAVATFGTTIQQNNGNLYIDNTGTTSINIGTVITTNTVNIGSNFNLVSKVPTFNGGRFNNISVKEFSNMQHTDSIGLTNWTAIGQTSTTDPFQTSIIPRSSFSQIRVTVNMSLNNWGTTVSNHHISLRRSTSAMTYGTTYATESVSSVYGINHILSGVQYQSANFTWIDRTANTAGTPYYYCVVARSNTAATVAENLGNNSFCDLHLEELY